MRLEIGDRLIAQTAKSLLDNAGVPVAADGVHVISDDMRSDPAVLIVECTPARCRAALQSLLAGRRHSLVAADELADVVPALRMAQAGHTLVASGIIDLSAAGPTLTERQQLVLHAVLDGASNSEAGDSLHLSPSTVKREIQVLFDVFGVRDRRSLRRVAQSLGFRD